MQRRRWLRQYPILGIQCECTRGSSPEVYLPECGGRVWVEWCDSSTFAFRFDSYNDGAVPCNATGLP
jgi:hypothetical protein